MADTLQNTSIPTTALSTDSIGMHPGEIFTLIVMLVVSTLSLTGNLLVIGAVYMRQSLRTPNNLLLLNLAIADLGQGIVAMPLRMTEVFNRGTEPLVPCQFVLFVTILFFGGSMITVALISIDRFIAIRWPFLYVKSVTSGTILPAIACCWVFTVLLAAVPYMGAAATPTVATKFCFYSQYLSKAYLLAMFSIVNILIVVILLFTNVYLLKETIRHITRIKMLVAPISWNGNSQNVAAEFVSQGSNDAAIVRSPEPGQAPGQTRAHYHRFIKATRVTLVVVGFTIVLTTPIMVIDLVSIWNPGSSPPIVTRISVAMAYANSCVNPWIFARLNKLYRQTYIEVLKRVRNFLLCKTT